MPRWWGSVSKLSIQMNDPKSLILASIFGLVAGMSHGVVSHFQEMPFSLSEQLIESFGSDTFN